MRIIRNRTGLIGMALIAVIITGCLLSGTFVIRKTLYFTAQTGFYFYQVNLTENATWKEHKDDIHFVETIGVELFINSSEPTDVTFNCYVDEYSGPGSDPASVPPTATKIIDSLTVPPGHTVISYAESLKIITGLDRLKTLAEEGMFDFYGTSTGIRGKQ